MIKVLKKATCPSSETEFFHCCFEVYNEKEILAKISLYINPYHTIELEQALTIGNFECVNDQGVFNILMDAVVKEAKEVNLSNIIGPINGNTWNEYRLVSTSNAQPFLLDVDTPQYYIDLYKGYGFETLAQYYSEQAENLTDNWEKNKPKYEAFIEQGVSFHEFDMENATRELEGLAELCNASFSNNFLFSPITKEAFVMKMMPSLSIMNPRYTLVAKVDNRPVGFIFCYQNLHDKVDKTIVVKTLARDLDDQYKGMGNVLSSLVMKNVIEDDFTKGIHALMLISNSSTYISSSFAGNFLRSYELLQLKLNNKSWIQK
ncbi:hypothetical protein [Portibacter lacus]|uniref:N-acetyltransferase domain-containing protein n=1 Tax=Portibacter lacus TaxID=1099794 RepID=A0AA37SVN8_9BACT|nr:hypothetical protein [Portibacter lacus]GLR18665.1 hypothetical protein GCM10007940_32810 [Portibacter lacus]